MTKLAAILLLACLLAFPAICLAQETDPYGIVVERNIFDSTRQPKRIAPPPTERPEPVATPIPVKREYTRLTGTALADQERVAFFSGDVTGRFRRGDEIEGFRLESVSTDSVLLMDEASSLTLPVGREIMREDDGPWRLSSREIVRSESTSTRSSTSTSISTSTQGDAPVSREELLKRLLERRQKELNP